MAKAKPTKPPTKKEALMIERIKADNAAYEAMSEMERRVHVAKEIRSMIKRGVFVPGGGYGEVSMIDHKNAVLPPVDPKDLWSDSTFTFPLGDLQPIIRSGGFECVGCAKAAIIVARASVGNKVKVTRRSMDEDGYAKPLADKVSSEVFGAQCADLIEALYESWSPTNHADQWKSAFKKDPLQGDSDKYAAFDSYRDELPTRFDFSADRMLDIYTNIIKNKGHLVIGPYKIARGKGHVVVGPYKF